MTPQGPASPICVIFDLDGTLVDSETLGNQAFLDLVPELNEPLETVLARYRGKKLTETMVDIETRTGKPLPDDFVPRYRARSAELFEAQLCAMPGASEMLDALPYAKCIASGGPRPKIELSLKLCGLARHFGDRIFSSYDIEAWKPDPALFLHASRAMGYPPERCVVIEDSDVGVEAAKAAGMRVLCYLPHEDVVVDPETRHFTDLLHLPDLLREMVATQ